MLNLFESSIMKNYAPKIIITTLTFAFGIAIVCVTQNLTFQNASTEPQKTEVAADLLQIFNPSPQPKSGKVEIHFRQFLDYGNQTNALAEFELVNDSEAPAFYDACTLAMRNNKKEKKANFCLCGNDNRTRIVQSGETLVFTQSSRMMRHEFKLKEKSKGQFGFNVTSGVEPKNETLWSEEVKFPE